MAYTGSDPTNFVGVTNGVHYDTNVKDANLQHVIVTDSNGNDVDYIIVEGDSGDTEFWTIVSDGSMTLQQTLTVGSTEQNAADNYTVVQGNDGQTYLFDTDRDGASVLYFDKTADQWVSIYFTEADLGHGSGQLSLDVFVDDSGVIRAYSGDTNLKNTLHQWVFDPATKNFIAEKSYSMTTDLGMDQRDTTENGVSTRNIEVLETNDGPKLLVHNQSSAAYVEGFTIYDIDPATGDLIANSAASYNYGASADGSGLGLEVDFVTSLTSADEAPFGVAGTIEVDSNGNIVLLSSGVSGNFGMVVIDPRLAVKDINDQDGDGDVDQSASIIVAHDAVGSVSLENGTVPSTAWKSNLDISYSPDGKYMYLTGEDTTLSSSSEDTAVIVIDTKTYDIVTWGQDITSGYYSSDPSNQDATTDNLGAKSQIIVTLSTGEQYYLGQYVDTPNGTTGWLFTAAVDANLVTEASSIVSICFAAGTYIKTLDGDMKIENLQIGDKVLTKDSGYQPIRWIGSTLREAAGSLAPILIRKGALGNTRDLRVSPQHRMLISGWQSELLFGEPEVLVAAKHLVNDCSILRVEGGMVEYFHILFDKHEIIFAEDCPTESFLPGSMGLKSLSSDQTREIFDLFPELEGEFTSYGISCRPALRSFEGKILADKFVM